MMCYEFSKLSSIVTKKLFWWIHQKPYKIRQGIFILDFRFKFSLTCIYILNERYNFQVHTYLY